jgi:hypothetical protein
LLGVKSVGVVGGGRGERRMEEEKGGRRGISRKGKLPQMGKTVISYGLAS